MVDGRIGALACQDTPATVLLGPRRADHCSFVSHPIALVYKSSARFLSIPAHTTTAILQIESSASAERTSAKQPSRLSLTKGHLCAAEPILSY
jgi:hypothetical protein